MADHTRQYCDRPITVTPFGVDCERFRPLEARSCSLNEFVVGTVKNLESASGVELLIRSFAIAAGKYRSGEKLRLVIAGEGVLRKPLERLTDDLGIQSQTTFLGFVPHGKVPELLGTFSVFAMLSLRESSVSRFSKHQVAGFRYSDEYWRALRGCSGRDYGDGGSLRETRRLRLPHFVRWLRRGLRP